MLSASEERPEVAFGEDDAIWTGWAVLIPDSTRELVGHDETADEFPFQAHVARWSESCGSVQSRLCAMLMKRLPESATIFGRRRISKLRYNQTEIVC